MVRLKFRFRGQQYILYLLPTISRYNWDQFRRGIKYSTIIWKDYVYCEYDGKLRSFWLFNLEQGYIGKDSLSRSVNVWKIKKVWMI